MTKQHLLLEVEDLLRTMPVRGTMHEPTPVNLAWLGRVSAVIKAWEFTQALPVGVAMGQLARMGRDVGEAETKITTLLYQAQHDLRMTTVGPVNVAIQQGMVFDYFDEMRKFIETARQDVLFVDPYLDADFVSRYLSHIESGTTIRLLTRAKLALLLPAVDAFAQQSKRGVQVRSSANFHDRYVIIDKRACYHSGASFKDGAKGAPTTLSQIADAFPAILKTYEDIWNTAKVER